MLRRRSAKASSGLPVENKAAAAAVTPTKPAFVPDVKLIVIGCPRAYRESLKSKSIYVDDRNFGPVMDAKMAILRGGGKEMMVYGDATRKKQQYEMTIGTKVIKVLELHYLCATRSQLDYQKRMASRSRKSFPRAVAVSSANRMISAMQSIVKNAQFDGMVDAEMTRAIKEAVAAYEAYLKNSNEETLAAFKKSGKSICVSAIKRHYGDDRKTASSILKQMYGSRKRFTRKGASGKRFKGRPKAKKFVRARFGRASSRVSTRFAKPPREYAGPGKFVVGRYSRPIRSRVFKRPAWY